MGGTNRRSGRSLGRTDTKGVGEAQTLRQKSMVLSNICNYL